MQLDGLRADEQRGADLAIRLPAGDGEGDLELLWSQLVNGVAVSFVRRRAGRTELAASPVGPCLGSLLLEQRDGGLEQM